MTHTLITSVNDVLAPKTSLQEYPDFDENQVQHWVDSISEKCIQGLADLQKPFKYIVTCTILQSVNGAGVCMANSAYFDEAHGDFVMSVHWPSLDKCDQEQVQDEHTVEANNNKRQPQMLCVVTAIGISVFL